jgi:hypothetical protein
VKFSGIDAWDSRVSSTQGFTSNAYLQFAPTSSTGWFMMGLAENPTTTAFSHITYAISCNNGAVAIYQSGFFIQSYGTYTYGDTFRIIFTGTSVQYYRNNTLLRSAPRNVGAPLYMSCSLYSVGIAVKNLDFHAVYAYVTSPVAQSTSGFLATVNPGPVSLAPIYFSLLTDLAPSLWSVSVSAGGNAYSQQSSLYADIYFNTTLITTTNVLSNLYLTTPSTYTLNFSVPTTYAVVPGDTLNVKLQGNRAYGDSYIYTNSIGYSTVLTTSQPNPNTVEYLEFFHNTLSTGLQTSELTVWISPLSTHTTSYVDSNVGLVMNKSYIKWESPLNGVTIENSYNDISARSLTYTGALYNASDSNLKHSIEYINPEVYMTAISELPLRRYAFNNAYLSTFNLRDRAQLGVITSEVEPIFPSMIRSAPFEHCGLESVNTVDRTQLRYAHLAATQGLIIRISTLKAAIKAALKAT